MMVDHNEVLTSVLKNKENTSLCFDKCFICDQKVSGEKVVLSAAIAPHSKVGLAEKISELIGEDYVVIITEHDLICKRCASLLNHMDKLQNELTLVTKALLNYLQQKYDITIDEPAPTSDTNGIDDEQAEEPENESEDSQEAPSEDTIVDSTTLTPSVSSTSTVPSTTNLLGDKKIPGPKLNEPSVITKPLLEPVVPKMKIYKCGFCTFQSKELNSVRAHMKIHVKTGNKLADDPLLTTAAPKQEAASPPLPSSTAIKRRLFRCQVCSISFADRAACVEHISTEHTNIGKKRAAQLKEQMAAKIEVGAQIGTYQSVDSTTDKVDDIKTEDIAPTFVSDNSEFFNTMMDTDVSSDSLLLNTNSVTELPSLLSNDSAVKEEHETEFCMETTPMETDSLSDALECSKQDVTSSFGKSNVLDDIVQSITPIMPGKPLRKILPKPEDPMTSSFQGLRKSSISEKSSFDISIDRSGDILLETTDKSLGKENEDKKNVHSIDIEAMIAALHSDGPVTSL